ncbi:MAG: hypothetical protein MGF17_13315 [Trichodesmium sp. MAG_R04]|nr:hypothetical protein [Trichodesmium sp. MAG_R04]
MDRDLIGMRESEEGLNLEKPLEIFDGDGNAQYAAKDLQAYLFRIATEEAKKLYETVKDKPDNKLWNLEDIHQIGCEIACEKTNDIVEQYKYKRKKISFEKYVEKKLSSEISSRYCKLVGMNDRETRAFKHTRYFNLKNPTGKKDSNQASNETKGNLEECSPNAKNIKKQLEYSGYSALELERRLLSWKCFNQVYAPSNSSKYERWTERQLKEMAELYLKLRRRSPTLQDDNLQVNAELIDRWLEDCLSAWYKSVYKLVLSLDSPLQDDDTEGERWKQQIPDHQYADDSNASIVKYDASEMNYYQAMGDDVSKSLAEFCQTLNKEQYRLLLLRFSFDWGDVARNLAPLLKKHPSTINRQYTKIKGNWLKKLTEELGIDEKSDQSSKNQALSSYLDEVWQKYAKPRYKSIIYQKLHKIFSKLDPTTTDMIKGIEGKLLQWLEAELEMPLAQYEPLTKKISNLVEEFLGRITSA